MKHYRSLIIILSLILSGFLVQAQDDTTGNIIEADYVYVRSGPDDTFPAIQAVFAGENVEVFNISESGNWLLIAHPAGTGWIPRESTIWQTDIDALPVLAANITPTAAATLTATPFIPTEQPPFGFILISGDAEAAFVREGPGRGYPVLGELAPGELVEPVSRNADTSWMLIRYSNQAADFEGFGWLSRPLAAWSDETALLTLPIMLDTGDGLSLTPTLTFTPSPTVTASFTPVPTITFTPSDTPTISPTPTQTLTLTPSPTSTIPTATDTPSPTATATIPTATSTPTATVPTATSTTAPTNTDEPVPTTAVPTTVAPSEATTESATENSAVVVSTEPITTSPERDTATPQPEATATETPSPETTSEVPAVGAVTLDTDTETPDSTDSILPIVGGVVGVIVLLILLYAGLYAQGAASAARYEDGFIIERCPVCGRGTLYMEGRVDSLFGIPRPRRTVRCNVCRSVLRERSSQRWTYAVDRIENPILYKEYNGREISDAKLKDLRKQLPE